MEDASPDELIVDCEDSSSNDTNDAILAYFARMSNHYLCLASAFSGSFGPSRHSMKYPDREVKNNAQKKPHSIPRNEQNECNARDEDHRLIKKSNRSGSASMHLGKQL